MRKRTVMRWLSALALDGSLLRGHARSSFNMKPMRMSRLAAFATVAFLAFAAVAEPPQNGPVTPAKGLTVDDVLWWLPTDTESVIVASGPFGFPPAEEKLDKNIQQSAEENDVIPIEQLQSHFRQIPLIQFWGLPNESRGDLDSLPVLFALESSRHVRYPPLGDDVMKFEGCSIAVFKTDTAIGPRLQDKLIAGGGRLEAVGPKSLVVIDDPSEPAFFASPRPGVLIACNNREYLRSILLRTDNRQPARALPRNLREWRYVNRAALFWGFRHYEKALDSADDPTSPFNKNSGAYDPQAIGFVFSYQGDQTRIAMTTLLSGDAASVQKKVKPATIVVQPEPGAKVSLRRRSPAPGVLQTFWTLDRYNTASYYLLEPLSRLGHGILH